MKAVAKVLIPMSLILGLSSPLYAEEASSVSSKAQSETNQVEELMAGLSDEEKLDYIVAQGKKMQLINYFTNEMDVIEQPHRMTAEQARNYVPPLAEIQAAFDTLVERGVHPLGAMVEANVLAMEVLSKGVPEGERQEPGDKIH